MMNRLLDGADILHLLEYDYLRVLISKIPERLKTVFALHNILYTTVVSEICNFSRNSFAAYCSISPPVSHCLLLLCYLFDEVTELIILMKISILRS